jgi:tungstate transport system substrate-binding protein
MNQRKIANLLGLLLLVAMLLSACASPAAVTQPPLPAATTKVEPTAAPTTAPAETQPPATSGEKKLILATTTSTQDSGLLDDLLPMFKDQTGVTVDVVAVGSGQALQLGKDGNADVLLVHSPSAEVEFMQGGDGVRRDPVMYNDFVIIGPASDPAGIKGMTSAADAFKKIADTQSPFISRGDKSGTNTKELAIWKAAGIEPAGDWYLNAGAGMGEVLTMAKEKQAYTLSDRGTYLAQTKEGLDLPILVEGDKSLFNPYHVITVDPAKSPKIQADLANQFADWIISVPVQEEIGKFGTADFGQPLFTPNSNPWRESQNKPTEVPWNVTPEAPAAAAALKVTGKVAQEMGWTEAEVKALPTLDVESTNKQGQKETYTGVLIADLLKQAGPAADAATVVFVADDGYTVESPLAEIMACTDCIVSFRSNGGFSIVMPGADGKHQVKGVIELQVK